MTKAKAIKLLLEYSRFVVEPKFATKLAKAFGFTLKQLGFKSEKKYRLTNAPIPDCEETQATGISIYDLSRKMAENKTKKPILSGMHGAGSYAQDITEQACEILKTQ